MVFLSQSPDSLSSALMFPSESFPESANFILVLADAGAYFIDLLPSGGICLFTGPGVLVRQMFLDLEIRGL